MSPLRGGALGVLLGLGAAAATAAAEPPTTAPASRSWNFRVRLDGRPIGEHRFSVAAEGAVRRVESVARFDVKLLLVTAYRYRHRAVERWQGDCLSALSATTDDDGQRSSVVAARDGDALAVESADGRVPLRGCVMTYAYWHPDLRGQRALLNPQTGRYDAVRIETLPAATIEVRGQRVEALPVRLVGPAEPIVVWYSAAGDWLGLDATVAGGRTLTYRLDPDLP